MSSIIDMHAHYVSPALIQAAARSGASYGVSLAHNDAGKPHLVFNDGVVLRPFFKELCDLDARLPEMAASDVEKQVLSTWTDLAGDNLPAAEGARWARLQNETLADDIRAHPERFIGMATLPMQDVSLAITELEFVVDKLGMRSIELGTNINGRDLDHEDFRPLWRRIRDLDVFVLLHPPMRPIGLERTGDYFLNNLISYPVDTTIAAARLLFSGVFEQLPGLKICLAHSGGFLPYQIGRMERGFDAHPACKISLTTPPSQLLNAFIYDSLTHNDAALSFLLEVVGPDRVVYGSDYPFEMLDPRGPDRISSLTGLDQTQRANVLGGNMRNLLQDTRSQLVRA